jgi:phage terminase large subunit-like protein
MVDFWTPGDTLDQRSRVDNVPYRQWRDAGHLFAPPGRMIDKGYVASHIRDRAMVHDLGTVAYDQAMIEDFHRACADIGYETWVDLRPDGSEEPGGSGLRLRRHGQGWPGFDSKTSLWMPRSIETLERLVVKGELQILFNPVLRWNSASAVLLPDASNNRRWDKRKSTGRIDGIVALSMAVGALIAGTPEPSVSIWDREELWAPAEPAA